MKLLYSVSLIFWMLRPNYDQHLYWVFDRYICSANCTMYMYCFTIVMSYSSVERFVFDIEGEILRKPCSATYTMISKEILA